MRGLIFKREGDMNCQCQGDKFFIYFKLNLYMDLMVLLWEGHLLFSPTAQGKKLLFKWVHIIDWITTQVWEVCRTCLVQVCHNPSAGAGQAGRVCSRGRVWVAGSPQLTSVPQPPRPPDSQPWAWVYSPRPRQPAETLSFLGKWGNNI